MTESSHYAERYFPEHGIRYLAPGSNFDSEDDNPVSYTHLVEKAED